MTYTTIFTEDAEYQKVTGEYLRKRELFEEMARQGLYNKDHLKEVATKLHSDLQTFVAAHSEDKKEAILSRMDELQKATQKTGYAERADDAKEFEIRYKLANDSELEDMVTDLNTTDLLEINLLRMELKNRDMEQHDQQVKRYTMMNKLDGMTVEQQQEKEALQYQLGVFSTLGTGSVILGDELTPLDRIEKELKQSANQIVPHKDVSRDVNFNRF